MVKFWAIPGKTCPIPVGVVVKLGKSGPDALGPMTSSCPDLPEYIAATFLYNTGTPHLNHGATSITQHTTATLHDEPPMNDHMVLQTDWAPSNSLLWHLTPEPEL